MEAAFKFFVLGDTFGRTNKSEMCKESFYKKLS
jgi:hypothetical protein